ncbi:ferredoxin [bacterium]|nr:MAG: ferredoxin [bacterium]
MRIKIDKDLCVGCGMCIDICPYVFDLGDDGKAKLISKDPDCSTCDVEEASEKCVGRAIEILEDDDEDE